MIVTVFKKLDSEVVKSMIYDRDKKRMLDEGWLETYVEADAVVKRTRKSKESQGESDGDDSGATS
jgi:hypothetical protein